MKQFLVFLAAVGLMTVVSCSEAKKESITATPLTPVQKEGPILPIADTAANLSVDTATVPAAAAAGQAPELNPPHGQPYHRCDIAVGSPLSGAPAAQPAATINQSGAPTMQNVGRVNNPPLNNPPVLNPGAPTVANANGTPPKLNPAHGQPFHRCEIPVGSPLN